MKRKQGISLLLCFILIATLLSVAFAEEILEDELDPEEDPLISGYYYLAHSEVTGYECIDSESHYKFITEYWENTSPGTAGYTIVRQEVLSHYYPMNSPYCVECGYTP